MLRYLLLKIKICFLIVLFSGSQSLSQTSHYVTSGADNGPGTLRSKLDEAQPFDTILFNQEIDTVYLTTGELSINKSIFIIGNMDTTVILKSNKANDDFRIICICSGGSLQVHLELLELTRGRAPGGTPGSMEGEPGGAVYIPETNHSLTMDGCIIADNRGGNGFGAHWQKEGGDGGPGGGIYSNSSLIIKNSRFFANISGSGARWINGNSSWYSHYTTNSGSGGAIYCTNDISLTNTTIEGNLAREGINAHSHGDTHNTHSPGGDGGHGGGLLCNNGNVQIENCRFTNNHAGKGGNGNNVYSASGGAGGNGGAVHCSNGKVNISNTYFDNNSSGNGGSTSSDDGSYSGDGGAGGAIFADVDTLAILGTTIINNNAGSAGSALYYSGSSGDGGHGGGAFLSAGYILMEGCTLEMNSAGDGPTSSPWVTYSLGDGGSGGGLWLKGGSELMMIRSCIIKDNHAGNGGRLMYDTYKNNGNAGSGGGIYIKSSNEKYFIVNCEVSGNQSGSCFNYNDVTYQNDKHPRSGSGGGIYSSATGGVLVNVTCAGNRTGTGFKDDLAIGPGDLWWEKTRGQGGGLYAHSGGTEVINSLFAFNNVSGTLVNNDLEGLLMMDYCFVRDSSNATIVGGNNIFNMDPYFVFFPDTLMITSASWAIDNGNPDTSMLHLPMTDLAGNPRIFNNAVDIGAYEYQGFTWQNLDELPEIIDFGDIIPWSFSLDTLEIINTGLQAVWVDSIYCFEPFNLWSQTDSCWTECIGPTLLSPYPPDNFFRVPLKFSTGTIGQNTDKLYIQSSFGLLSTDLTGRCADDSGIEDHLSANLIFPNPSDGDFTIKVPYICIARIVNNAGTDIAFCSQAIPGGLKVHLIRPSRGIYFVKGILGGRPYYFKVIVIP